MADSSLVLSLFPGIGLLDMAFEEEGFCVVRGPDLLWGGDVRRFHPPAGKFDGVIGGPPCQLFSALKRLNPRAGEKHGNMIPEFERVIRDARPLWFLMENVPGAPRPVVMDYQTQTRIIRDVWVGGETMRERAFTFGSFIELRFDVEMLALHAIDAEPAVCSDARTTPAALLSGGRIKKRITKEGVSRVSPGNGPRLGISEMLRRQGLPPGLLDECPLTDSGKRKVVGNGVPLPMGRAIARAVKRALTP